MFILMPPTTPVQPAGRATTARAQGQGFQIPDDREQTPVVLDRLHIGEERPDPQARNQTRMLRGIAGALSTYREGKSIAGIARAASAARATTTAGKALRIGGGVFSIGTTIADTIVSETNYAEMPTVVGAVDAIADILKKEGLDDTHINKIKELAEKGGDLSDLRKYLLKPKEEGGCDLGEDAVNAIIGRGGPVEGPKKRYGLHAIIQDRKEASADLTANRWCTYTSAGVALGAGIYAGVTAAAGASSLGGAVLAGVGAAIPVVGAVLAIGALAYFGGKLFGWW